MENFIAYAKLLAPLVIFLILGFGLILLSVRVLKKKNTFSEMGNYWINSIAVFLCIGVVLIAASMLGIERTASGMLLIGGGFLALRFLFLVVYPLDKKKSF